MRTLKTSDGVLGAFQSPRSETDADGIAIEIMDNHPEARKPCGRI